MNKKIRFLFRITIYITFLFITLILFLKCFEETPPDSPLNFGYTSSLNNENIDFISFYEMSSLESKKWRNDAKLFGISLDFSIADKKINYNFIRFDYYSPAKFRVPNGYFSSKSIISDKKIKYYASHDIKDKIDENFIEGSPKDLYDKIYKIVNIIISENYQNKDNIPICCFSVYNDEIIIDVGRHDIEYEEILSNNKLEVPSNINYQQYIIKCNLSNENINYENIKYSKEEIKQSN